MGNESGNEVMLVLDCISYGKHEIQIRDGVKLKKIIQKLASRINVPVSKIREVLYNYSPLDKNRTISELGLKSGSVLLVKFND